MTSIPSIWHSKLVRKYTLAIIGVFVLMGIIYSLTSLTLANYYLNQVQTRIQINMAQTLINDHQLVKNNKINLKAIKQTFNRYMILNPNLEIYWLNLQGHLVQYSANHDRIKRFTVDTVPIQHFLTMKDPHWLMGDDPRSMSAKKPFSVAYLPNAKHPSGYLYVILRSSKFDETNRLIKESLFLKLGFFSAFISLGVGIIFGVALFYRLGKRIQRLSNQVTEFESGHWQSMPYPPASHHKITYQDELNTLENEFVKMTLTLQRQFKALKDTQQQHQYLLSSVSHDLRTPLTNLLGYLEQALEQENTSNPLIEIAYKNAQRLKKQTDQLFEFVKLEQAQYPLKKQEVSISELVSDLIEQTPADIKFIMQPEGLYLSIVDPFLMQRAVQNLIQNALKYSHNPIEIILMQSQETIMLSVKDFGEGMSPKTQSNLFKPFYRAEAGREKNEGSGLGLAIVQEIMQKHQGSIKVVSQLGQGSCLTLIWPKE